MNDYENHDGNENLQNLDISQEKEANAAGNEDSGGRVAIRGVDRSKV